jgi:hypothetical protein
MSIRCKFKVDQITRTQSTGALRDDDGNMRRDERGGFVYGPLEMWSVKMSPVYANGDPNHENSKFWSATPSGHFEFQSVNKEAVQSLELGGEYYIDIVAAPPL